MRSGPPRWPWLAVSSLGITDAAAQLAGAVTTGPYTPLLMLMSDPDQRDELDQAVTRLHGVLGDVSFERHRSRVDRDVA